ncbi:DNA repair protein RecO [Acidisoma sp. S159]|uniref:DNA repair protein RecO n=1 Tax=Acidisoma sp. S159 TaxID=1747225 RepID=UPI00131DB3D3|nr:DNA repair protein RecO [Acidisoma sp. S159]
MEWEAPGLVLDGRAYGEGDLIVSVFTEEHGVHRGLARGGASRGRAASWQAGNLLHLRWVGRLPDQLGSITGEVIQATAASAMAEAGPLALLRAACAVAAGALPEREGHPRVFLGLLRLLAGAGAGVATAGDLARWEMTLLADLGYGLDITQCAVTGATDDLHYVSPRTGRAVAKAAVGIWRERLLRLPPFLRDPEASGDDTEWRDALRLTGHFLERDAFGHQHRPLPEPRRHLYETLDAAIRSRSVPVAPGGADA